MSQKITTAAAWRTLRIKAGYSQRELADAAGIAERTIRGIETGDIGRPRMSTTRSVAKVLGVSPADLLPEEVAA